MMRSPEHEALGQGDDPVIADNAVRRKQLVGGAVLVLLGDLRGGQRSDPGIELLFRQFGGQAFAAALPQGRT